MRNQFLSNKNECYVKNLLIYMNPTLTRSKKAKNTKNIEPISPKFASRFKTRKEI
jgi:hypothetical protein